MKKTKRLLLSFSRMAVMPALFLLMLFAGSQSAYAANYDLYIGSTQVTDANAGDIFGDGTAKYDAGTQTLYLNGVTIGADNYYEVPGNDYSQTEHYSMYAGRNVVKHLVITGNNSFVSAGSENVYRYVPTATDDDGWTTDANGDGIINAEDMTPTTPFLAQGGIYFSTTGSGADNAFTITGTGTLTSTSTDGYCHDYDDNNGELLGEDGYRREENLGTALTIDGGGWVYIGNENGTGPTLKLTGWNVGTNFGSGRFAMQGGTIIAKANNPTMGTGIYLSKPNFFEGGTIAGYGKYSESKNNSGAFSDTDGTFDTTISKEHGMQRVYPATIENDVTDIHDDTRPLKIRRISGWVVVGMTKDAFKASTDAVLQELGLDGSGGGDNPGTDPVNPGTDPVNPGTGELSGGSYHTDALPDSDADINVWGYTKDKTVYSVDVEWGAMTFEYEASKWNPETHKTEPGTGWQVYDSAADKVLDDTQAAINKVTVTNHSNAPVYATLSYTGNESYADITGSFTKKDGDTVTDFTAASGSLPDYLTLATADNDKGTEAKQGKETAGTVYFMPTGIGTTGDAVNKISKWQKIGKITVGILTEQP